MKFADRIARLGTETAFAVSAEAAAFAAQGNKVYPFHLGDMNIPTPANVMEAAAKAMRDGKTGYCPNAGIPKLREVLAADVGTAREDRSALAHHHLVAGSSERAGHRPLDRRKGPVGRGDHVARRASTWPCHADATACPCHR